MRLFRNFLVRRVGCFLKKLQLAQVQITSLPCKGNTEVKLVEGKFTTLKFDLAIIASSNDLCKRDETGMQGVSRKENTPRGLAARVIDTAESPG